MPEAQWLGRSSSGAGEANANEKGGRTEAGFSADAAVLGRGPNGNPSAEVNLSLRRLLKAC
jgi:hypothetical protein